MLESLCMISGSLIFGRNWVCTCRRTHLHIAVCDMLLHRSTLRSFGYMEGITFDYTNIITIPGESLFIPFFSEICWFEYTYTMRLVSRSTRVWVWDDIQMLDTTPGEDEIKPENFFTPSLTIKNIITMFWPNRIEHWTMLWHKCYSSMQNTNFFSFTCLKLILTS